MIKACLPLSRKNSPIAHPEYGARYCSGAASDAVAETTIVYFMASIKIQIELNEGIFKMTKVMFTYIYDLPESVSLFTIWATVERF